MIEQPRRGVVKITASGRAIASDPTIDGLTSKNLPQTPTLVEFLSPTTPLKSEPDTPSGTTPEERIEGECQLILKAVADDLLDLVKSSTPQFFEKLVVELLVAMGYGGFVAEAGQAVGRPGDGGIDGIIKQDPLGLDIVCVQAKRWGSNTVGRPDVQAFAGSMDAFRASKGVFFTTSQFSAEARQYVSQIGRRIVLIDGRELARLMTEHDIGVSRYETIVLKRVDSDYFES